MDKSSTLKKEIGQTSRTWPMSQEKHRKTRAFANLDSNSLERVTLFVPTTSLGNRGERYCTLSW